MASISADMGTIKTQLDAARTALLDAMKSDDPNKGALITEASMLFTAANEALGEYKKEVNDPMQKATR